MADTQSASSNTGGANGGDLSWKSLLIKYGPWTLLVFYLLGAIPGLKSPIDRLAESQKEAMASHSAETVTELGKNRAVQKEVLHTLRAICTNTPGKAPCAKPSKDDE